MFAVKTYACDQPHNAWPCGPWRPFYHNSADLRTQRLLLWHLKSRINLQTETWSRRERTWRTRLWSTLEKKMSYLKRSNSSVCEWQWPVALLVPTAYKVELSPGVYGSVWFVIPRYLRKKSALNISSNLKLEGLSAVEMYNKAAVKHCWIVFCGLSVSWLALINNQPVPLQSQPVTTEYDVLMILWTNDRLLLTFFLWFRGI